MCSTCPLMGLTIGADIELYYTVELEEWSSPKKFWFSAVVKRLRLLVDNRGTTLDGHVSFQRTEYFPASTSHIVFISAEIVRDDGGEDIPWRFRGTLSEHVSPHVTESVGAITADAPENQEADKDADYLPVGQSEGVSRPKKVARVEVISGEEDNRRNVLLLKNEMKLVRAEWQLQKEAMDIISSERAIAGATQSTSKPDALLFLFHKLERFLLHTPPRPGSDERRSGAFLKQQAFHCSCDCTLYSLDSIMQRIKALPVAPIECHPSIIEIESSVPMEVKLYLPSLQSVLDLYGPMAIRSIKDITVMTRKDRITKAPIACRVIGCVERGDETDHSPLFLAVGEHLDPIDEDEMAQRKVLYRESGQWNTIENRFHHPMTYLTLSQRELSLRMNPGASEKEEDQHSKGKKGFLLLWKNLASGPPSLFQPPNRRVVLGTLTIEIPYVNVVGSDAVGEIENLLNLTK